MPEETVFFTATYLHLPRTGAVQNPMPRRRWLYGNKFEAHACQDASHEVYRVRPAGCFPVGSSPYGCEGMSGNVWEWTRSIIHAEPSYPNGDAELYELGDTDSNRARVLPGGSFRHNRRPVRCAACDVDNPDLRYDNIGFRVVLSPFPRSSEASDL